MIFSTQRIVEDRLRRLNIEDDGRYPISISNIYAKYRSSETHEQLLARFRRIPTPAYRNNPTVYRSSIEQLLLKTLDQKLAAQPSLDYLFAQPKAQKEMRLLRKSPRRSIRAILESFQRTIESRTVDAFWKSRIAGKLIHRPETVAQALLTQFIMGSISAKGGQLFREIVSGIGFVDIAVMLSTTVHLLELKVQTGKFIGPAQLDTYMRQEERATGWLVIFDARKPDKRNNIPSTLRNGSRTIHVLVIDINPVAPSKQD